MMNDHISDDGPAESAAGDSSPEAESAAGGSSSEAESAAGSSAGQRTVSEEETAPSSSQSEGAAAAGQTAENRQSGASTIAGGIFSSRIMGLLRQRTLGYFFGVGAHADVFVAALRAPNMLQNLLGEGTISATFIPTYVKLLEDERPEAAGRFAGAIFGLLLMTAAGLALLGVLFAPYIIAVFVPGWINDATLVAQGDIPVNRYELTVTAVRIIFPMTAVLVLSAWALGILNSHRRFFLPYFAPVLWNTAIIGGFFIGGAVMLPDVLDIPPQSALASDTLSTILLAGCAGALAGGALQFLVQVPLVVRVLKGFKFSISTKVEGVKKAIRAFGPVVAGRGVYQLSAYLDLLLGGFLAAGAISAIGFAQTLYMLPISLFGMSVAAAELPELSRIKEEEMKSFVGRIRRSLGQMLFMTVPTVIGYLAFGFLLVAALFQTGSFGLNDTWLVFFVLCAYSLGVIATAATRLLQNSFYAIDDTKTPAKVAVLRVVISAVVAIPCMLWLDQFAVGNVVGFPLPEQPRFLGAVGLALGSAAGAWAELYWLKRKLSDRLANVHLPIARTFRMGMLAVAAVLPGALVWWALPDGWHPFFMAACVIAAYGFTYVGTAYVLKFDEMKSWTSQIRGKI